MLVYDPSSSKYSESVDVPSEYLFVFPGSRHPHRSSRRELSFDELIRRRTFAEIRRAKAWYFCESVQTGDPRRSSLADVKITPRYTFQ